MAMSWYLLSLSQVRVAFSSLLDGQKLVVSGRRNGESEVTVLDLDSPNWDACRQGLPGCTINTTSSVASFNVFNSQRQTLLDADVRLPHPNLSVAAGHQYCGPDSLRGFQQGLAYAGR